MNLEWFSDQAKYRMSDIGSDDRGFYMECKFIWGCNEC